jgi:hypothetical protein
MPELLDNESSQLRDSSDGRTAELSEKSVNQFSGIQKIGHTKNELQSKSKTPLLSSSSTFFQNRQEVTEHDHLIYSADEKNDSDVCCCNIM